MAFCFSGSLLRANLNIVFSRFILLLFVANKFLLLSSYTMSRDRPGRRYPQESNGSATPLPSIPTLFPPSALKSRLLPSSLFIPIQRIFAVDLPFPSHRREACVVGTAVAELDPSAGLVTVVDRSHQPKLNFVHLKLKNNRASKPSRCAIYSNPHPPTRRPATFQSGLPMLKTCTGR